jgi:hypothetical protein
MLSASFLGKIPTIIEAAANLSNDLSWGQSVGANSGNVEKGRQRRSRPFVVLTYYEYAPRVKVPAALLNAPF